MTQSAARALHTRDSAMRDTALRTELAAATTPIPIPTRRRLSRSGAARRLVGLGALGALAQRRGIHAVLEGLAPVDRDDRHLGVVQAHELRVRVDVDDR